MKKMNTIKKNTSIVKLAVFLFLAAFSYSTKSYAQAGDLDTTFNPGEGIKGTGPSGTNPTVTALAVQSDGKILLGGGGYTHYDGKMVSRLVRIESDGKIDNDFANTIKKNPQVVGASSIIIQPDGKIILGGGGLVRILPDGSLDSTFFIGIGTYDTAYPENSGSINAIALQPDGKIIIAGSFMKYDNVSTNRYRIVRINVDGTVDTTFKGRGFGTINAIAIQPDGKILIAGTFHRYGPAVISRKCIARINADGTLDESFDPGKGVEGLSGAPSEVETISLQKDGKVIIAGWFSVVNGVRINRVARLNANGSLDTTFNVGNGISSGQVYTSIIQPDGKILLGGLFGSYNGFSTGGGMTLINTDGSPDTTFKAGASDIKAFALQPDGKILIGGTFLRYNGVSRSRIARIVGQFNGVLSFPTLTIGNDNEIIIYPNPFNNEINIKWEKEMSNFSINIYDTQNKLVFHKSNTEMRQNLMEEKIDLNLLNAGMYFLQITTDNQTVTYKIIKK